MMTKTRGKYIINMIESFLSSALSSALSPFVKSGVRVREIKQHMGDHQVIQARHNAAQEVSNRSW